MDPQMMGAGLITTIAIGAVAGWLAGLIMKGQGMGFVLNTVLGIIGAFVGSYVFNLIGFSMGNGLLGVIATSTAGAVILLFIVGLLRKSQ